MAAGSPNPRLCVLALTGGVGGAKLALGLLSVVAPQRLTVVVNTGDDFEHLGLRICPDIDTMTYTLGGQSNPATGWGRAEESWRFLEALGELGGETWFRLGDRDLATHVERTRRLQGGETLSEVTAAFCHRLGVRARVVPMSDDAVRTVVLTAQGPLPFQHYFVRERCRPVVTGFRFEGAEKARSSPGLRSTLEDPQLGCVVVCPSNPFISIDPILALPGLRLALRSSRAPVVAVSPIVGGQAVKGPTAKIMAELGMPVSPIEVAHHYGDLLDGMVVDGMDSAVAAEIEALDLPCLVTDTVMVTLSDKIQLARAVLAFALNLTSTTQPHAPSQTED